jgi:hypothetical protein
VKDNVGGKASVEKVTCQDQVYVELEAGVIKDKVYAALLLAFCLSLLEQSKGLGKIVGEDVLLSGLSSLAALQLLNIIVGHVGK